jgi:universal stress protein E
MAESECILIVVDPTADESPAVSRGFEIARRLRIPTKLFICDYQPEVIGALLLDPDRLTQAKREVVDDHVEKLARLAEKYAGPDVEIGLKVAWDHPLYEGIVREALECNARFVVKDTHYHSAISRALFTNTDWHLIRSCPAPLWLVKPDGSFERPSIIASVDPLHEHDKTAALDVRLLSEAFEIAGQSGGTVDVFHSFNPFASPDNPDVAEETHGRALLELTDNFQIDSNRVHLLAGNAADLLPRIADELSAGLVVMGAVSRSRLENAIVGSTAESVLDRLPCDVLIIKPKGFVSPITFKTRPRGYYVAERD